MTANMRQWPEPAIERANRKQRVQKRRAIRKALTAIDTRTPSGKPLPY